MLCKFGLTSNRQQEVTSGFLKAVLESVVSGTDSTKLITENGNMFLVGGRIFIIYHTAQLNSSKRRPFNP